MRPLKLVMQAFGVYPNRVEIPFENIIDDYVYLISGVTGSGKTTIFDAISFALFNQASGTNRENNTFRSHYAGDDVESFVEFTFELRGEIYTVIRSPSYQRKKLKKDGFITVNSKAQLTLPNSKLIIGVKETDDYIVNLLGVNADQFRQIALLAQGEFLKLLNTDTQKRGEIFRNIFKTNIYSTFSTELKEKAYKLKDEYDDLQKSIIQYASQLISSNEKVNSYIDSFKQNDCIYNLDDFISEIKFELNCVNDSLEDLESKTSNISNSIKKNDIEISRQLQKKLLFDKLKSLDLSKKVAKCDFDKAKLEFDSLNEKNKKLDEYRIMIEKQKSISQKIDHYKHCQNAIVKLSDDEINYKNILQKCIKNLFAICGGYCSFLDDDLSLKQEAFLSLKEEVIKKTTLFNNLNLKFLSMQAGILASNLADGAPCPVCGSKKHPNLAKCDCKEINFDLLEKYKKELKDKNDKLTELSGFCSALKQKTETIKKDFFLLKKRYDWIDDDVDNHEIDNESKFLSLKSQAEVEILNCEEKINSVKSEIIKINSNIDLLANEIDIKKIENIESLLKKTNEDFCKLQSQIQEITKNYYEKKEKLSELNSKIILIKEQLSEFEGVDLDIDNLKSQNFELQTELNKITEIVKNLQFKKNTNNNILSLMETSYKNFKKIESEYNDYKILSDCANGTLKGRPRIPFEQYIQGYYLDLILFEANKHLKLMTKNQFQLLRKKNSFSLQAKAGLDIEVMDFYTFKTRSVKTLSGGESFKAALSLALGLSDVVSSFSGGVNLDALFIDEGFGSLDAESLESAIDVIISLARTGKLIGIISHVEELKNKIDNKIISVKTEKGSSVEIVF